MAWFNHPEFAYDTGGHWIAGISFPQQSSGGGLVFSTTCSRSSRRRSGQAQPPAVQSATDVFATLQRLGELLRKGILTEEEFAAKKAELLSRL